LPYSCISFHIFFDKDLSISLFLALNAKGREINRPKQKDHNTTLFSETFFSKLHLQKTLLTVKGRTFSGGGILFSQKKSI
jgi:hypothetical protein